MLSRYISETVQDRDLAPFLRYSEILVENRRFQLTPSLFVAPVEVDPFGISREFWQQKTRVLGLSYGVVCVMLGLEHRLVTDRRTDGHTMTARAAL